MKPAIRSAAQWLLRQAGRPQPKIIPTLRQRFGLSPAQAITAICEANRMRAAQIKE